MNQHNNHIMIMNRTERTLSQLFGVYSVTVAEAPAGTLDVIVYTEAGPSLSTTLHSTEELGHFADAVQDYTTSALADTVYPINFEISI